MFIPARSPLYIYIYVYTYIYSYAADIGLLKSIQVFVIKAQGLPKTPSRMRIGRSQSDGIFNEAKCQGLPEATQGSTKSNLNFEMINRILNPIQTSASFI